MPYRDAYEEQVTKHKVGYQTIGRVIFGNGTEADVIGVKSAGKNANGDPKSRFILQPLRTCIFTHRIKPEDYDSQGNYVWDVEAYKLLQVNQDPTNVTWISTVDIEGNETALSREEYIAKTEREINNANATKKSLSIQNAQLKAELEEVMSSDFKEDLANYIAEKVINAINQRFGGVGGIPPR